MVERIQENPFPKGLEERISVVASAVNTELKIATLFGLDGSFADHSEIRKRVRRIVGKDTYLPQAVVFEDYGDTLFNLSFLAKKTITRDTGGVQHEGYSLSDAGGQYGLPAALLSLRYGVNAGLSMFQILGSNSSHGSSRAPYNRIKILDSLNRSDNESLIGLAERIGLNPVSTRQNVRSLEKIEFVRFTSVGPKSKNKIKYRKREDSSFDNVIKVGTSLSLTFEVVRFFCSSEDSFSSSEVAVELGEKNRSNVSNVISGLLRQGFLEVSSLISRDSLSNIRLSEKGIDFCENYLFPLRELLSDSFLDWERLKSFRFSDDFPDYLSRAIGLYKKVSPHVNRKSRGERIEDIRNLLSSSPWMTTKEIGEVLGISSGLVGSYIRKGLHEEIKTVREQREVRYSLKQSS